ncbi:VWA domain-containing protein [Ruminococcaceae bacterium OttesenSCG-928-A16]|nr:VWA domain-containing protein [Ruminococcaceae bacterium OttesenSCG-928-A16]
MTQKSNKSISKKVFAILLACALIVTGSLSVVALAVPNVLPQQNNGAILHAETITTNEVWQKTRQPQLPAPKTYTLPEYAPEKVAMEEGVATRQPAQLINTTNYELDPEIFELVDTLTLPLDSTLAKQQLLEILEGKVLLRYFNYNTQDDPQDHCQILVLANPATEEVFVVGLNPQQQAPNNHEFKLTIIDDTDTETTLENTNMVAHTVTRQTNVLPEELASLQQQSLVVEVVEEVETLAATTSSTIEAEPPQAGSDSLPLQQADTAPQSAEPQTVATLQGPAVVAFASGNLLGLLSAADATSSDEALPPESTQGEDLQQAPVESEPVEETPPESTNSQPESVPQQQPPVASNVAPSQPQQAKPGNQPQQNTPAEETPEITYNINIVSEENLDGSQDTLPLPAGSMLVYSGVLQAPMPRATVTPATLNGKKTATKVSGTADIFRIDLDIGGANGTGTLQGSPADVVVVLDMSGSMDESGGRRWNKTKEALNSIADGLLSTNVGHSVAIVGFSSQAYLGGKSAAAHRTICPFTSSKSTFTNSYSSAATAVGLISATGEVRGSGTNSHAGFVGAQNLLLPLQNNGRPKFIIFITDGAANYYYTQTSPTFVESTIVSGPEDLTANDRTMDVAGPLKNIATIYSIGVDINLFNITTQARCKDLLDRTASNASTGSHVVSADGLKALVTNIMNSLNDSPTTITHGTVKLTDNMSTYVEYQPSYGIKAYQSSNNGASWSNFTGTGQPTFSGNKLSWSINNFSPAMKYRVTYYVRLKPEHYGKQIHKNQTNGAAPASGTDGVIANGDTFLSSDAVTKQTVLVPTVYVPQTITTPATLTASKTATAVPGQDGVYDITLLISGTPKLINTGGVVTKQEHTSVTLTDPMSPYVNYLGNVQMRVAQKGSSVWGVISSGYAYTPSNQTSSWVIPNFSSDNQYKLTYRVSVKPEYAGQKLHKDQTSGRTPTTGTDGVIANAYTRIQSSLVAEKEIMVPTVFLDNQISVTPATMAGSKIATPVEGQNGLYTICVTVQGQPKITVTNGEITDTNDHTYAYLVDPMSDYVDYIGNAYTQRAPAGTEEWEDITGTLANQGIVFDTDSNSLHWLSPNYSSTYHYRLFYQVQVKPQYAGAKLHANQSPGETGTTPPLPGTDGVAANKRTYFISDIIGETDILVPTVYRAPELVTPPSLAGHKTASKIEDGDYEYDISVVLTGEKKLENGYGGDIYTDHGTVTLTDPMSDYVMYLGNPRLEVADKGASNWQDASDAGEYDFIEDTETLQWVITNFNSEKQYRITYTVKVKAEYENKALHKTQTHGDNPEAGLDGVIANKYTSVSSSLLPAQEILVPAIGDPQPIVSGGALYGRKTASLIPESDGKFEISLFVTGEKQTTVALDGTITEQEHQQVTLTDPMSEYVDYAGNAALWAAERDTEEWVLLEYEPSYDEDTATLVWEIQDFSSDKDYKITYEVTVKDAYADAKLHKNQTSGQNPTTGTDGVVANGFTTLSSTLVEEQEILVPTVYRGPIVISDGSLEHLKTATPVEGETGQFEITVWLQGENYATEGYNGRYERDHNFAYVVDPMSEYVNYLNQYTIYQAPKDTEDWGPATDSFVSETATPVPQLEWYVLSFDDTQQYKLVYLVEVKPEYYGQKLHQSQTSGQTPQKGEDGLIANGYTTVYTEIIGTEEILVPTVYVAEPGQPLVFTKVGRNGSTPLDGVEFALYSCTQGGQPGHVHDILAVPGSCWAATAPQTATSQTDGKVDFGDLPLGEFMLAETKAQSGYALPSGQWLVTVTKTDITFTARYQGADPPPAFKQAGGVYTVANYQYDELPASGAGGIVGTTLAGIALLALMLTVYWLKCRRRIKLAEGTCANGAAQHNAGFTLQRYTTYTQNNTNKRNGDTK